MTKTIRIPQGTAPTSDAMAKLLAELMEETSLTDEAQSGHWVSLHSDRLLSTVGNQYRKVIVEAEKLRYLKINDRYSEGRFPKSYRLEGQYRDGESQAYELKKKRRATAKPSGNAIEAWDEVGQGLFDCFDKSELRPQTKFSGWSKYAVDSVLQKRWRATRCSYNRFHSSFTSIPKRSRPFLFLDDSETTEIDVSNCQPLLLGILCSKYYSVCHDRPYGGLYHMSYVTQKGTKNGDLNEFVNTCCQGGIYEAIENETDAKSLFDLIPPAKRHPHAKDRPVERKDIKKAFLVAVFSPVADMKAMPVYRTIERLFPSVAEFLIAGKSDPNRGHQAIAEDCQKFESKLMIDTVAAHLVRRFPIITIHDAIICPRTRADEVEREISQAFASIGLGVKTKRTQVA